LKPLSAVVGAARLAPGQQHDVPVADPIGRRDHTSSPGFRVAIMAFQITGLPPGDTFTWLGL
jgi:hypothetical protein